MTPRWPWQRQGAEPAVDPRPDPATWSPDELEGKSPDEVLAVLEALKARSEEEATARRGRPLQPGDISDVKGRIPIALSQLQRPRPDGTWETIDMRPPRRVEPPADTPEPEDR